MDAAWAELREFIRRLNIADADIRRLRLDADAAAMALSTAQQTRVSVFSNASFSGQVVGCDGTTGIPGALVVCQTLTGAPLGLTTADSSGNFTGYVGIPGTTSVHMVAFPGSIDSHASRWQASGTTATKTLNIGANAIGHLSMQQASGFRCNNICPYPLPTTLSSLTDSFYGGPASFVYNGVTAWQGSLTTNLCSAGNVVQWTLDLLGNMGVTSTQGANFYSGTLTRTSVSINPFTATYTWSGGAPTQLYCGHTTTVTVNE